MPGRRSKLPTAGRVLPAAAGLCPLHCPLKLNVSFQRRSAFEPVLGPRSWSKPWRVPPGSSFRHAGTVFRAAPAVPPVSCPQMKSPRDMTDEEIVAHLKFSEPWYRLGVMDEATLRLTVENFRRSDDDGDEHWRYGAFMHFLRQNPTLTPDQCEGLFWLGAADPDWCMGQSIMLQVIDRPECPDRVLELAAVHERTKRYHGGYVAGRHATVRMLGRRAAEGRCLNCGRRLEGSRDACPWCSEPVRPFRPREYRHGG